MPKHSDAVIKPNTTDGEPTIANWKRTWEIDETLENIYENI